MNSRRVAKISLILAIVTLVVAVAGFITTLVLNVFFLDDYDAYGEVPIPGSASVHLPAGQATVSLHTLVIGGTDGGLPVPPLRISITPPDGVAQPEVTESIGTTTTVNNDAHIRVWNVQVPADGTYNVVTDGQVNGYINPRLAFGHQSSYGYLVWVFVGLFVVGLVDLTLSIMWLGRVARRPVPSVGGAVSFAAPAVAYEPTGEGVRVERLKTLASLRDSGALTEEEFQEEKRRILYEQ
ncbi:SHOCT domain-containing protein [Mycobacterium gordonae]|uniref:SHOCT domain-containing protein n=1 Tax=Mycobacterium gordonae TaxID=1778 RepID=UPI0021098D15|nr:SHOCT domain-containing protein [Mycobacterium gordonae]MCQ4361543.1 SHOCT domain-containing protein [Mycobacterium gordonae]